MDSFGRFKYGFILRAPFRTLNYVQQEIKRPNEAACFGAFFTRLKSKNSNLTRAVVKLGGLKRN